MARTAVQARRIALQMIGNTIIAAPDDLRDGLRKMTRMKLIRTLAAWRPDMGGYRDMATACRIALKSLARRYLERHDEIGDPDAMIMSTVDDLAPELVARRAIGYESAARLLITAGANPERPTSEANFAALCGVSPTPAFAGKGRPLDALPVRLTRQDRPSPPNRGGDRATNSALHIIAICRLRYDERTKSYVARRIADGLSKLEALRCVKRYIAREVHGLIRDRYRQINELQRRA